MSRMLIRQLMTLQSSLHTRSSLTAALLMTLSPALFQSRHDPPFAPATDFQLVCERQQVIAKELVRAPRRRRFTYICTSLVKKSTSFTTTQSSLTLELLVPTKLDKFTRTELAPLSLVHTRSWAKSHLPVVFSYLQGCRLPPSLDPTAARG